MSIMTKESIPKGRAGRFPSASAGAMHFINIVGSAYDGADLERVVDLDCK